MGVSHLVVYQESHASAILHPLDFLNQKTFSLQIQNCYFLKTHNYFPYS